MFCECNSLTLTSFPNISRWKTNNVTDMSYMFYNCKSLLSLPDISKWNTSNVTDMSYMFYNCKSLKSFPDISFLYFLDYHLQLLHNKKLDNDP